MSLDLSTQTLFSDSISEAAVRQCAKHKVDVTLLIFVERLIKYGALSVTVMSLLSYYGINTSGLPGLLASLGISVGFASQKVLANLAAGVMLLIYRPYIIGDHVTLCGKFGLVRDISLFDTRLDTTSNIRIRIPNSEIYGKVVAPAK